MSKFEVLLSNKEEEPILNEWDKKILLEVSKNVVDKILKEFRGRLPDGIIYPDESARPLAYLFNPIFEKISKETSLKPFAAIKAFRMLLPSSVFVGIFCKLGLFDDILPVVVPVCKNVAWSRPSASTIPGMLSMYVESSF